MIHHIAHLPQDLLGQQVAVLGGQPGKGVGQRVHRAPQLHHLPLEQVDGLDIGLGLRREGGLLDGVDIGLHRLGHPPVGVNDVVGDRVHDAVGPQRQRCALLLQPVPQCCQTGVVAMAHRNDEIGPDEHHDLAGLDDLVGQVHRFVRHVVHGFEHQEQGVVVPLDLRPLMRVHRVLDYQRMQSVHLGHRLHVPFVGLVQTDPHEGLLPGRRQFPHCGMSRRRGVAARDPLSVGVDGAVHDGIGHRRGDPLCLRFQGQQHIGNRAHRAKSHGHSSADRHLCGHHATRRPEHLPVKARAGISRVDGRCASFRARRSRPRGGQP